MKLQVYCIEVEIFFSLSDIKTILNLDEPEIRSYFPESWLWEEHAITDRYPMCYVDKILKDTTVGFLRH